MAKMKKDLYTMTVIIGEDEISHMTISKKEYEKQLSRFDDLVDATYTDEDDEFKYYLHADICRFEEQHFSFNMAKLTCGLTVVELRHHYCDDGYFFDKESERGNRYGTRRIDSTRTVS